MSSPESLAHPFDVARLMFKYPFRWFVPAVLVAVAVGAFATVRLDTWEASQQLMVRNEAAGNNDGPGKFRHGDELKTLLETILEVARGRPLLADALRMVDGREPTDAAVTDLIDLVKLSPPKGAEFGKTEVFYLKVKDNNRARSLALCTAICEQLERRFNQIRGNRARGMLAEVEQSEQQAASDMQKSTDRLAELEKQVGGDLSELRNLFQTSSGGESDLRRKTLELESELRQATIEERRLDEWRQVLASAKSDPERLLTLPSGPSETQGTLRKLNDNLLDARLRTAQLLGLMTREHPQVAASLASEREIVAHFDRELSAAIRAAETDWRLAHQRVERLQREIPTLQARVARLAGMRAEYAHRVADLEQRTRAWNDSHKKLVDGRAALSSAETANLITRIDNPDTGSKPIGPGRTALLGIGVAGGLIVGLGVLVLSVQATSTTPLLGLEQMPVAVVAPPRDPIIPPVATSQGTSSSAGEPTGGRLSLNRVLRKAAVSMGRG